VAGEAVRKALPNVIRILVLILRIVDVYLENMAKDTCTALA